MPMPHMLLQLRRPPAQEQALQTLIEQLHDPSSPNYHQWLSAEQLGAQFGPAASDIQTITNWLSQHGFTVNAVLANRMAIDFSGTAGQVRTALHTDIHYLDVNGVTRFANVSDPQIPAALAAAIVGVTGLHDIPPQADDAADAETISPSGFVCGPGFAFPCELVTPADLATIYNFNPAFAAGTTGQGQTIYLIEDTDLYTNNDWTTFRSTFGIPVSSYPSASLTTVNPGNCAHNVNGDDGEAILDAEYASAAAPGAAIVIASCADLLLAIQNVVNGANPPAIMSISYGFCESGNGAAFNQSLYTAYQTGVAAGMSIFVSSGDGGADSCDNHDTATSSTSGISASGFASTPYNVAVGGTDFSDTYSNVTSTYWNSSNSPTYGSARSYIPEIPWNNSCGSELYAAHYGFATTYGPGGLCNSGTASSDNLLTIGAGSGAPSSCATGSGACLSGMAEAILAERVYRQSRRRRARCPGRVAVCRRRRLGSFLHLLLFRSQQRRQPVHRLADQLEWRGRHVLRVTDLGRHPSAGEPIHRVAAGQSQSRALYDCRRRIWRRRQQHLQCQQRQHHRQLLHLLRRDAWRHDCRLHQRHPQLLCSGRHLRGTVDLDQFVCARFQGEHRLGLRHRHRHGERLQPGDQLGLAVRQRHRQRHRGEQPRRHQLPVHMQPRLQPAERR